MKTIEEFLKELNESAKLQEEFKALPDKDACEAFFKKNDCGFTVQDFGAVFKSDAEGRVSDDDAQTAAGGFPWDVMLNNLGPWVVDVIPEFFK